MIRVERSDIRSTIISSIISSTEVAVDCTAPVHGEQPNVRKRHTRVCGTSQVNMRALPSTGINCSPLTTTDLS